MRKGVEGVGERGGGGGDEMRSIHAVHTPKTRPKKLPKKTPATFPLSMPWLGAGMAHVMPSKPRAHAHVPSPLHSPLPEHGAEKSGSIPGHQSVQLGPEVYSGHTSHTGLLASHVREREGGWGGWRGCGAVCQCVRACGRKEGIEG